MTCNLQCAANISSVATLVITTAATLVGVWGYFSYRWNLRQKRLGLEDYLRNQKDGSKDRGQRTLVHLVRHVGLTEDEVIQLSFKSKRIQRRIKEDEEGYARGLLFEYVKKTLVVSFGSFRERRSMDRRVVQYRTQKQRDSIKKYSKIADILNSNNSANI